METARTVIAVVNKHVPRSFGDAMIHSSKIDLFVQDDTPLEEAHFTEPNEIETRIGKHCAALIEDGATLQMGIGAIPNAVLAQLGNHKNLGIHTEMFADGVLPLVEKGVINGEAKNIDKGKMVSTFLMGSQRVYDFMPVRRGSERPLFRSGSGKRRLASEKRAEEEEDQLPYSACLSETFDFQLSSGSRNEMTDAAIQKNATGAKS